MRVVSKNLWTYFKSTHHGSCQSRELFERPLSTAVVADFWFSIEGHSPQTSPWCLETHKPAHSCPVNTWTACWGWMTVEVRVTFPHTLYFKNPTLKNSFSCQHFWISRKISHVHLAFSWSWYFAEFREQPYHWLLPSGSELDCKWTGIKRLDYKNFSLVKIFLYWCWLICIIWKVEENLTKLLEVWEMFSIFLKNQLQYIALA